MPSLHPCSMAYSFHWSKSRSPISRTSSSSTSSCIHTPSGAGVPSGAGYPCRSADASAADDLLQAFHGLIDPACELRGVEAADRVLHDDQLWSDLPRLGLRQDERPEGVGGDHDTGDAALFEFYRVMETPRRAG